MSSPHTPGTPTATPESPVDRENIDFDTQGTDQEAAAGERRHSLPRYAVIALALAASLVALQELQTVKSLVAPVFFALNLIIAAYPLQKFLVRKGAPVWVGALAAGFAVILVLLAIVFGLSYGVAAMVGELPTYQAQFTSLYNQSLSQLSRFGLDETVLVRQLKSISPSSVMSVVSGLVSGLSSVFSLSVVALTTLIFMVMDAMNIGPRMAAVRRRRPDIASALDSFAVGVRKYWLVSTVFGLIVAVIDYVVLLALGVPLALAWAMFAFLTNYVPNVGFVVGLVPPALLALVDGGWKTALLVVAAYCVINFIIQTVIQPRVAGDAVGLTPTMSFLSLLLWGWVFGGLGALIALPVSLLCKALLIDLDPSTRWVDALVASDPAGVQDSSADAREMRQALKASDGPAPAQGSSTARLSPNTPDEV